MIPSPVQMLQHVMYCHHVGTGQCTRQPEQLRDVHQVAAQSIQNFAKFKIALGLRVTLKQRYSLKIRRQVTNLLHSCRGPDEEVLVMVVQSSKCSYNVANVSANTELGHSPDINGHLHVQDLTTKQTREHKGI